MIFCADNMYSDNGIILFALIENEMGAFRWWGKVISVDDMKKTNKMNVE